VRLAVHLRGMTKDQTATVPPDLGALFVEHRQGLIRLALLLVGDQATAEDVVQDAFAGLHRRWHDLRDPAGARAYARAAVVNAARMVMRRRALIRRIGVPHEPPIWSAEAAVMLGEDHREVMRAIQRLPQRRREAVILRYYLDLGDTEIAQTMGISEVSVRSTISRALRTLGHLLEEDA